MYTTKGPVRGGCGHLHRSLQAARACIERDARAVKRGHGPAAYSDRVVYAVDGEGRLALVPAWIDPVE